MKSPRDSRSSVVCEWKSSSERPLKSVEWMRNDVYFSTQPDHMNSRSTSLFKKDRHLRWELASSLVKRSEARRRAWQLGVLERKEARHSENISTPRGVLSCSNILNTNCDISKLTSVVVLHGARYNRKSLSCPRKPLATWSHFLVVSRNLSWLVGMTGKRHLNT
jgi:hypothetical protein